MKLRRVNYESMLNPDLMKLAKSRGIILSNRQRRGLGAIRGVEEDTLGEQARDEVVSKLKSQESIFYARFSTGVAILSLIGTVFALLK